MSKRKVFVSVLGTGSYSSCRYQMNNYISVACNYVQEATLDYLQAKDWSRDDMIYILLTEDANARNWVDNGQINRQTQEKILKEGLKSCICKMELSCQIEPVMIKNGKNSDEIMYNFTTIFNLLQNEDELYFDLTHGFRYLPMLVLVMTSYSKLLKDVSVKHLSYGNYEMRNQNTNIAPFVDLSSLSLVQDWTVAAASYLNEGNADGLALLCKSSLAGILKRAKGKNPEAKSLSLFADNLVKVVEERRTCRGIEIIEGESISILNDQAKNLTKNILPAFTPIIDKIKESLSNFCPDENILNGYQAADWCFKNGLYQQSCTIFQENVISDLCMRLNLDWKNRRSRDMMEDALYIIFNQMGEDEWRLSCINKDDEKVVAQQISSKVREMIEHPLLLCIAKDYRAFKDYRNEFNHAGMTVNHMNPKSMHDKLEKQMDKIMEIFENAD